VISQIKVRKANIRDNIFLSRVHNFGVKRGYFCGKQVIKPKDRIFWLKNQLSQKYISIYVSEIAKEKKSIGYVKFERVVHNIWEVNLANLPLFIGKGLGSKMLDLAIQKLKKYRKVSKIVAVVKNDNIASQKCFKKKNFLKKKFNTKIHKTLNQCDAKKNLYFELSD